MCEWLLRIRFTLQYQRRITEVGPTYYLVRLKNENGSEMLVMSAISFLWKQRGEVLMSWSNLPRWRFYQRDKVISVSVLSWNALYRQDFSSLTYFLLPTIKVPIICCEAATIIMELRCCHTLGGKQFFQEE